MHTPNKKRASLSVFEAAEMEPLDVLLAMLLPRVAFYDQSLAHGLRCGRARSSGREERRTSTPFVIRISPAQFVT